MVAQLNELQKSTRPDFPITLTQLYIDYESRRQKGDKKLQNALIPAVQQSWRSQLLVLSSRQV
ncbi:hypothetical protein H6G00_24690 [Leptolyngbya sp. FACHB-541]|uniref:hypothetical protein n=1 Tax=Leptolyngbya sp. FACHB-541 TaxID=2692810 RepID=UPI0016832209|nr:hypothetical protein [Leptolyngbya sp. FACHB-541]MBD1999772.1 hypothetical protein [Leptolyngbya sp. FACHB-541]